MTPGIHIITGHYGSGKTEFAMNLALAYRKAGKDVAVVDLDIINMYFRIREQKEFLNSRGIQVISASVDAPNLDIPALDSRILAPLQDPSKEVILDTGGNPAGARAIGRYENILKSRSCEHLFVVNANRPETGTAEDVIGFLKNTEGTSGLKVTGLVNNTHMLKETTVKDISRGDVLLRKVSRITGLPVRFTTIPESILDECPKVQEGRLFPVRLYFRSNWMV